MRFLTLANVASEKTEDAIEQIKKIAPPAQGKIVSTFFLMGRFDIAILFDAPDEKAVSDWVTGKIRGVPGVTSTETFLARELQQ
ncbi:MAG: hypothetical protein ACE5J2_01760 [Nitrososphaerales archaeon]